MGWGHHGYLNTNLGIRGEEVTSITKILMTIKYGLTLHQKKYIPIIGLLGGHRCVEVVFGEESVTQNRHLWHR